MTSLVKKILILIFLIPLVSACSGTGTKIKPSITSSSSGNSGLYITREADFFAGGVLAKIEVNDTEIAKLGVKENITHNISNNYKIKVSGVGIAGIGMGTDSTGGINDGKNHFYIISVKQDFFSTSFKIRETTENGFNQSK